MVIDNTDVTPATSGSVTNTAAHNLTGVGVTTPTTSTKTKSTTTRTTTPVRLQVHHQYAQDKGVMESQYLGISLYENSAFEMGNLFNRALQTTSYSVGVALEFTTVGFPPLPVKCMTATKTYSWAICSTHWNAWDLNSVGDSKWVWLPLETPVVTYDTTLYWGGGPRRRT